LARAGGAALTQPHFTHQNPVAAAPPFPPSLKVYAKRVDSAYDLVYANLQGVSNVKHTEGSAGACA